MNLHHLTDDELVNQLTLRNDLTDIEHDLLDRLVRALDVIKDLENDDKDQPHEPEDGDDA